VELHIHRMNVFAQLLPNTLAFGTFPLWIVEGLSQFWLLVEFSQPLLTITGIIPQTGARLPSPKSLVLLYLVVMHTVHTVFSSKSTENQQTVGHDAVTRNISLPVPWCIVKWHILIFSVAVHIDSVLHL